MRTGFGLVSFGGKEGTAHESRVDVQQEVYGIPSQVWSSAENSGMEGRHAGSPSPSGCRSVDLNETAESLSQRQRWKRSGLSGKFSY